MTDNKTNLVVNNANLLKTRLLKRFDLQIIHEEWRVKHLATLLEKFRIQLQIWLKINSTVVGTELNISLGRLDPTAGCDTAVSFLEESCPVFDSAEEVSDVDKVKFVGLPSPVEDCIVDFESYVWWNPFWLAGGEVCAYYFDVGKAVGEFTDGDK